MTTYIFIKKITITTNDPNPMQPEIVDHNLSAAILKTIPRMGNTRVVVEELDVDQNQGITLIKNNEKLDLTDLEWIDRLYQHLMGDLKFSKKKAFSIIYYLQEHLPVFPDQIEQCSVCGGLFDSYNTGYHSEVNEKDYCSGCDHLAPKEKK